MAVNTRFQFRRDTAANWALNNPLLLSGELGVETDTGKLKMGNGISNWTGLGYLASGPQGVKGDTGSTGTAGTATLDFGVAPGKRNTTVAVTGQAGILSSSRIQIWVMCDFTSDHSSDEHLMAGIRAACSLITPGVGFTINAITDFQVTGTFIVHWVWI